MSRFPLLRILAGGLACTPVALVLVAVAIPGERLIGDASAQVLGDGALGIVAVTMVGAAYYTLRAGGFVPGPPPGQKPPSE